MQSPKTLKLGTLRQAMQNFLVHASRFVDVDGDHTEHLCNYSHPPHISQLLYAYNRIV
jgi:hypothetical protein